MEKIKTHYALMVVHTGEVKMRNQYFNHINKVKKGDLLTFKRKKDALDYINNHLSWALMPVKVLERNNRWEGEDISYSFC